VTDPTKEPEKMIAFRNGSVTIRDVEIWLFAKEERNKQIASCRFWCITIVSVLTLFAALAAVVK
jgi:hypothetical protein